MKKCSKFILLVALAWSLGHVQAQISHNGCYNDTTKNSSAIGFRSESRGECSFASGFGAAAGGDYSFASGYNSSAMGNYSFASGNNSSASGNYSFASGNNSSASGNYSFAFGFNTKADKSNAVVFGSGKFDGFSAWHLTSPAKNSFLIGFENKPIFYAQLDSALSHRVGIGTTAPKTALDVLGTTRTGKLRVVNNTLEYTGDILGFYPVSENGGSSGGSLVGTTLMLKDNRVGILTDNPMEGMALDVSGMTRTKTLRMVNNLFQFAGQDLGFYSVDENGIIGPGEELPVPSLFLNKTGVGVLTDNPKQGTALDVNGVARAKTLRVVNGSIQYTGQNFGFFPGGEIEGDFISTSTPTLSLKGNLVGVMTNNPTATLDVNGNIQADTVKVKKSIYLPNDELTFSYWWDGIKQEWDTWMLPICGDSTSQGNSGPVSSGVRSWMTMTKVGGMRRIGINTNSPEATLHVNGTIKANKFVGAQMGEVNFLELAGKNPNQNFKQYLQFGEKGVVNGFGGNDFYFGNNWSANSAGNNHIRIKQGAAAAILLKNDGTIHFMNAPTGTAGSTISNYTYMCLDKGNLGIGTESPKYPLDVNGDGNFSNIHTNNVYFHGAEMRIKKITAYIPPGGDKNSEDGSEPKDGDDPESGQGGYTTEIAIFKSDGNVGIGTTNPTQRLHVVGTTYLNGRLGIGTSDPKTQMQIGDIWTFHDGSTNKIIGRNAYWNGSQFVRMQQGFASRITFGASGEISFNMAASGTAGSTISAWNTITVNNDGSLGIGTTDMGGYKLRVNGKINCTEVVVTAPRGDGGEDEWPDYVFADDYELRSLDELSLYIQENQRLPEIPSSAEVAQNGVNLLQINTLLLKKVEELTLYILQQNDKMTDLQNQINQLKK